jgi:TPR repeat protein
VEQSYTEAVKWYKKAAEQGHEDAKKELDFMEF